MSVIIHYEKIAYAMNSNLNENYLLSFFFLIFAQNIAHAHMLEPPQSMF